MKKTLLIAITVSGLLSLVPPSFGQAAQTERWVCLKPVKAMSGKGNAAFRQTLLTEDVKPIPNAETYIVECLATGNGQVCTTGKSASDMVVYKKDNSSITGFKFKGLYKADGTTPQVNPMMSDATGELGNIEWESNSGHMVRKFLAMNYWTPTKTETGTAGGQQQGTFSFEQADKKCVKVSWDPYGRVFDSQTLEPVIGAKVTLLFEKNGTYVPMTTSDILGGNLINPQVTKEDGLFTFVVPDGNYKLVTIPTSVKDMSLVDTNYTKAYSDLYPIQTGAVIEQKGAIQHRDVPAITAITINPPKMMSYFYEVLPSGKLSIEGSVSHPLTTVNAKSVKVSVSDPTVKTPYRTIATTQADKWGNFDLEIDQNILEKTDEYIEIFSDVELVKTPLKVAQSNNNVLHSIAALVGSIIPNVSAQTPGTTTLHFEPIPQYLEGYAYGANGKAIPNATVEVYATMSNKAYSTTKADETGFFKITSEYLPRSEYELRFVTIEGSVTKVSPSQFIAQNQKTITEKKVDLYSYRDVQNRTIKDMVKPSQKVQEPSQLNENRGGTSQSNSSSSVMTFVNSYWWIIVSLVALIMILVLVLVVAKKRPPQEGMIQ